MTLSARPRLQHVVRGTERRAVGLRMSGALPVSYGHQLVTLQLAEPQSLQQPHSHFENFYVRHTFASFLRFTDVSQTSYTKEFSST